MLMDHYDLALISLYVFWLFFFGLIYYLRREDRREGYPMELDQPGTVKSHGFMWVPEPKQFALADGTTRQAPSGNADTRAIAGQPTEPWPGAPIEPTGANPMLDGIGPSSYAERPDHPDRTLHGEPKIVPMRKLTDFTVVRQDADPRGFDVVGSDGAVGGKVVDLWVDRAEALIRYLELEVPNPAAVSTVATPPPAATDDDEAASPPPPAPTAPAKRRVLFPMPLANVARRKGRVEVTCVLSNQFQDAPGTRSSDQVTMLEEERITAYFASGYLYSKASNREPLL